MCLKYFFWEELMYKQLNNIFGEYGIKVWCWRTYIDGLADGTFLS